MRVVDLMAVHGLTKEELASIAEVAVSTVETKRNRETPKVWLKRLQAAGVRLNPGDLSEPEPDDAAGNVADGDDVAGGRQQEHEPSAPDGAKRQAPPAELNYGSIAQTIAGGYRIGASAIEKENPLFASIVSDHADKAGSAWAGWIRSEPRVAALLARLAIGTPLGEVIGVHVSIGISYFIVRSSARDLEQAAAHARAATNGSPEHSPADHLA